MVISELGKTIRARRKEVGVTQKHLAELAGVNVNTLARIEKGMINPTIEVVNAIFEVLGMKLTVTINSTVE